jgi:hypothetical protein
MTRTGRRISFSLRRAPGLAMPMILSLGLAWMWPCPAEAAKLSRFLTAQDLAARIMLDQNGQPIQLPTAADRHPELAKGSTPTYLAIPLDGGEHLPASIPTIETGSQQGENPVGPLNFDTLVETNLNATLAKSRLAVVDTPSQNYLVEYMPRRQNSASIATGTVNELSHLLNTGSAQLTKLTQNGMNDLEKFLHIRSKTSSSTPILNLQAQVLTGDVAPPPIPEPSTWMIFAALIVGGALHGRRARCRARA